MPQSSSREIRITYDHAHELGAKSIFALIISRECLDAMSTVFGSYNITVMERGLYSSNTGEKARQTAAFLNVRLTSSQD